MIQAARDATVLPRAMGAEVGGRHVWHGGSVAVALWDLDLESEFAASHRLTSACSWRTLQI